MDEKEHNFLKVAFVSFQTEHQKNQVLDAYKSIINGKTFQIDGQKIEVKIYFYTIFDL